MFEEKNKHMPTEDQVLKGSHLLHTLSASSASSDCLTDKNLANFKCKGMQRNNSHIGFKKKKIVSSLLQNSKGQVLGIENYFNA